MIVIVDAWGWNNENDDGWKVNPEANMKTIFFRTDQNMVMSSI